MLILFQLQSRSVTGKGNHAQPCSRATRDWCARTCGWNNGVLTVVKIVFEGQASPNKHTFSQENSSHKCVLVQAQWSLKCMQPVADIQTQITHMYTRAHARIHGIRWAFVYVLSRSTFEYNSLYWHCWRELSKQLSRPLLWLRSVHWAVGWREQLKESQSLLSDLSAFWRGGVWQWNTALIIRRHGSEKPPDLKLPPNVPS